MGFRLVTLNLNGIRSAADKGFVQWADGTGADCMGVQEVKAQAADVAGRFERVAGMDGHFQHFSVCTTPVEPGRHQQRLPFLERDTGDAKG